MDITITPKETTGVERHLDVSIPADAVAAAEEKTARRYTSQARLPGFRPGKAPAGMVRKRFANEIRQETVQGLVQEAYEQLVEQEKLDFATQPHIHDLKFEPGTPLTFTFHVEVRPDVRLDRVERRVERRHEGAGERVALLGAVEREPGDAVAVLAQEQGIVHGGLLVGRCCGDMVTAAPVRT